MNDKTFCANLGLVNFIGHAHKHLFAKKKPQVILVIAAKSVAVTIPP